MKRREVNSILRRQLFIDETRKIIAEQSIADVSIRKVAVNAGYNVSTIYNYFDNLSHLIAISLSNSLDSYFKLFLKNYNDSDNAFEIYKNLWFSFIEASCYNVEDYFYIFIKESQYTKEVFAEYFKNNTDIFMELPEVTRNVFFHDDIFKRDFIFISSNFSFKKLKETKLVSEMVILLHKSLLLDLHRVQDSSNKVAEQYINDFKKYFYYLTSKIK